MGTPSHHPRSLSALPTDIGGRCASAAPPEGDGGNPWVDHIDSSVAAAARAGVIMQRAGGAQYEGRHVEVEGDRLLNFGGCSYLGLELREELKHGAIRALERYGTQFSFSRAYLESPLYEELESRLRAITGSEHVLVTPSTTLGHIAALPVLVGPGDAVVLDQFVHASVHTAAALLRNVPVIALRHSRLDLLEAKLKKLALEHKRVWYLLDGLYSMSGDFAPMGRLANLLAEVPGLHLYVDDAHSTSWHGKHGRGFALDALPDRSRVVVALSLNKGFSAAGGALVLPSHTLQARIRRCGGPMLFSGPVQPPMLGAAVASADLHLGSEFPLLQQALARRIDQALSMARELGVRFTSCDRTPIFFVRCGPSATAIALVRALRKEGFYTCPSVFPAVPRNAAGVRFTVSLHNTPNDIEQLLRALCLEAVRCGVSLDEPEDSLDRASSA